MFVSLDSSGAVVLSEPDNFRELYVDAGGRDLQALDRALVAGDAGRLVDGFAWLYRDFLEAVLAAAGAGWQPRFEGMFDFARTRDWTGSENDRETFRAHVVSAAR